MLLLPILLACHPAANAPTPRPVDPTESTTDTGDLAPWELPPGTCLNEELQTLGYLEALATLEAIEITARHACVRSWRCDTRRGFSRSLGEGGVAAWHDDTGGLFATLEIDDGGECWNRWSGQIVDDCPGDSAAWSVGCVIPEAIPVNWVSEIADPGTVETLGDRLASPTCLATGPCEIEGVPYTVVSLPRDLWPEVEVWDASGARVGHLELGGFRGDPALAACVAAPLTARATCGLVP